MIVRLKLRRNGGSTVVEVGAGGVCDNGRVRRVDVLFVADRSRDPSKFLHVGHPDVAAGLTGPGGSYDERDDIYEKDYPVEETECSDRLGGSTEGASATNDTTNGGSGLSTSGKPHDAQVRQPPGLEGDPRCEGTITEAIKEDHRVHGSQVKDCSRDTEG